MYITDEQIKKIVENILDLIVTKVNGFIHAVNKKFKTQSKINKELTKRIKQLEEELKELKESKKV